MSEQPVTEQPVSPDVPAVAAPPVAGAPAGPSVAGPALPPGAPVGPYDPAQVWAVPAHLLPPVRRKRTWVRTAFRWTTAVVVCAAAGVGTAVAVTAPRRTDIPGLKTPADTRYVFPQLKLPPLPPKASTPAQGQGAGHPDHAADLRKLLLPAPVGAKTDPALVLDPSGWYPTASYLKAMGNNALLRSEFSEYGMRHIAARAWTGPDGVRTEVYLLGFRSDNDASFVYLSDLGTTRPTIAKSLEPDSAVSPPGLLDTVQLTTLSQKPAAGQPAVRMALLNLGDVEAVIVMSNPKAVPLVNFRQVVTLQGELLQG